MIFPLIISSNFKFLYSFLQSFTNLIFKKTQIFHILISNNLSSLIILYKYKKYLNYFLKFIYFSIYIKIFFLYVFYLLIHILIHIIIYFFKV